MKKLLYIPVLACLIFACSKSDQLVETPAIDALSEEYDNSNFGNYKGVFTTLDSKTRGIVDVSITPTEAKATITTEIGEVHEFYSMSEIVQGELTAVKFEGPDGSFHFEVEADGTGVEITEVMYLNKPSDILSKKNTAKALVSASLGMYHCTNCGSGEAITHPTFTDNSIEFSFNFLFTRTLGSQTIQTQIAYGDGSAVTDNDDMAAGTEGSWQAIQGSNITGPDGTINATDDWVTISGTSMVNGPVTWVGYHNTDDSTIGGFWNFTYDGTVMTGKFGADLDASLLITGVFDGPNSSRPKGIEFFAVTDIPDLSIFAFGSANNGGGSDGPEYIFSGSASQGDFIYVVASTTHITPFSDFFGVSTSLSGAAANINGDDALELFKAGSIFDTFGDINVDGSGETWDYEDGWALRVNSTPPSGSSFNPTNWTYSGVDGLTGGITNATCTTPFPIGSYSN